MNNTFSKYADILIKELKPALGCTEPIAISLAAAKAAGVLGKTPDKMEIACSGNIIKNVMGVTVPNSGGKKGIQIAAALGAVGGDAEDSLQVLTKINDQDRLLAEEMVASGAVTVRLVQDVDNLFIHVTAWADDHCAEVIIANMHTQVVRIVKDGNVIFVDDSVSACGITSTHYEMDLDEILDFAESVDLDTVRHVLDQQIQCNTEISNVGLAGGYGEEVGKTLLQEFGNDTHVRAKARAAAGSDARMGGCVLPVVINSGSGNQGLTVSLPVIEYAAALNVDQEKLYRALVISNLIAVYQKSYIGKLSAFCGAVSAACGAGAAITYLHGGSRKQIEDTITNTLANVGGIVCDGAKPSCAAKIASSLEAAITGHVMSMNGHCFKTGEGIVQNDVESTMRSMGYIAREGMRSTDLEILRVMTKEVSP